MRLNTYLTEAKKDPTTPYQLIKKIQKECSQIIRLYQKKERVFYRGITSYRQWWKPRKARIRSRKPKDTPMGTHLWLNDFFKKKFGWEARNGVLATPNEWTALYYAHDNNDLVMVFLPVNRYKFVYSPKVKDLYDTLPPELKYENPNLGTKLQTHDDAENAYATSSSSEIEFFTDDMHTYTDKNLGNAFNSGSEVMFKPKAYYLIPIVDEYKGYPFEAEDILGFQPLR
jgi:hypothetical protein